MSNTTSLSLADLKARAAATQAANGPSFDAPSLDCSIGVNGPFNAEPRVFKSGGYGWYGSFKGEVDGVPVRIQVTVTIPGTKPAKGDSDQE